jgi:hypothetical protein
MLNDGIEGFFSPTGFLVTARNPDESHEDSPKYPGKNGKAARTRIQTRASWDGMMNQYIELITRL